MASPRIIKKYPNRRLYDTETSSYITLAEVKELVLQYKDFQVQDAKSGENLTRSILLQIILEEESGGVPMFSTDMLANIIRYYGHAMQGLMGKVGFKGTLAEFFEHLRTAPQYRYTDANDLLTAYQAFSKRVDPHLQRHAHGWCE